MARELLLRNFLRAEEMTRLNVEQKLNFLDLYAEEICARIRQNLNLESLGPLKEFLHKEQLDILLAGINNEDAGGNEMECDVQQQNGTGKERTKEEEEAEQAKRMKIAEDIWKGLRESALRPQLYTAVLEFLKPIDEELHRSICVELYTDGFIVGFSKMLYHSPALITAIAGDHTSVETWNKFSDCLRSIVHGFNTLVDPMKRRIQRGEMERRRAMKVLLRSIPVSNINGYEHILYAITNCGDKEAQQLVERIYPDFSREYDYLKSSALSRNQCFFIVRPDDDLSAMIRKVMRSEEPPPDVEVLNARLGKVPRINIRACITDLCKESPINLRPYQKELTAEAVEGRNVIICAPTGSGKTIVGAYIIREHLLKYGEKAKACFIVPTSALVDQQKNLFHKYMGHFAKVRGLAGSGEGMMLNNPIKSVIEHSDLVVITPQLLINEIQRHPVEIEESSFQPLSLDVFSLIIFDESHHSKDDHPYNVLMAHYHQVKLTGTNKRKMPQIVGMTASLGIGGSTTKNLDEAIRYTLEICANMDAQWISCVRGEEELKNLRQYMPFVVEESELVDKEEVDAYFKKELLLQLDWMRKQLTQVPEANEVELKTKIADQDSQDPTKQSFEGWLCNLKIYLKTAILPDSSRERLMFCVEQMLLLYYAIDFLHLFGPQTALLYVKKEQKEKLKLSGALNTQIGQWMQKLETQAAKETRGNSPLLDRLICILNEQFLKNKDSRVLIFLKQRNQCELLSTLLNAQIQHRTDYFTGQASREEGGQNMRMQKAKLAEFSLGVIKVLCATTVAEEGIDISKCNLILHYNYVTNEIARVQRRGRGRADDACSLLLTCDKSIKEKEEQNALREKLMHLALGELARWPRHVFQDKVSRLVDELNRKRQVKEALESEKLEERRRNDFVYRIHCSHCNTFLGLSTALALIGSTYVIADKDFWVRTKVTSARLPPEKAEGRECKGNNPHIGEHRCSCSQKLGRIVQYRGGVLLPNLGCDRIVFVRCYPDGSELPEEFAERLAERQWAKVTRKLFTVGNITALQLAEMRTAPGQPESLRVSEDVALT